MAEIAALTEAKAAVDAQLFESKESVRVAEGSLATLQERHDETRADLASKENVIDELNQTMSTDQRTAVAREAEDKARIESLEERVAALEAQLLAEQHAHEDDNHTRDKALSESERKCDGHHFAFLSSLRLAMSIRCNPISHKTTQVQDGRWCQERCHCISQIGQGQLAHTVGNSGWYTRCESELFSADIRSSFDSCADDVIGR